jgi:hypothetical protein
MVSMGIRGHGSTKCPTNTRTDGADGRHVHGGRRGIKTKDVGAGLILATREGQKLYLHC